VKHLWVLGILALFSVPAVGCGNSSATQTFPPMASLKLSLPEQVVAVPSTDSRFAMEAAIPMVVSEVAGVSATISGFVSEATNEATGVTSTPYLTVTPAWGNTIPAGGTVELPFRLGLARAATYRARVTIGVWDGRAQTFAIGEFRILPPQ